MLDIKAFSDPNIAAVPLPSADERPEAVNFDLLREFPDQFAFVGCTQRGDRQATTQRRLQNVKFPHMSRLVGGG
jgi:hypothetical protein